MPDGTVTPGLFDHRRALHHYRIPERLDGQRVLDVGTFDGFWAFEFERRGAEVIGLDVPDRSDMDWPAPLRHTPAYEKASTYANFEVARDLLDSSVRRERLPVYDATPDRLGSFDVVFIGSVLPHLRDPVRALEALRSVTGGSLHAVEAIDPVLDRLTRWSSLARFQALDGRMEWWVPNRRALGQMVEAAGYRSVEVGPRFLVPFRAARGGVPHAVVTALP